MRRKKGLRQIISLARFLKPKRSVHDAINQSLLSYPLCEALKG